MADVLEVSPKTVSLSARQSQVFRALQNDPTATVTWSVEEGDGTIDQTGVYRSPWFFFRDRTVVVKATNTQGAATATVELTSISFWTQFLGIYWLVCFAALTGFVLTGWKRLCPTCEILVSPPVVSLAPNQVQVFSANIPVAWTPLDASGGLFRAPASVQVPTDQRVTVTAASSSDPEETATAEVFLTSDFGFSLHPPQVTVVAGGRVDLMPVVTSGTRSVRVRGWEWLQPEMGKLLRKREGGPSITFQAPPARSIIRPTTVTVLARTLTEPGRIAGAHITIVPESSSGKWWGDDCGTRTATGLLALIAIMGSLGGLVHGISSYTTYVGNRELRSSWIWWYVFKPFLGALVAVVVYLVFRAGIGGNDLALSSADCLKTAAFAALIGLFAEPATIKLKDIFDTLFTPRIDPRDDRAGETKALKLERLDPPVLKVAQDPPVLKVIGSGFTETSAVKIDEAFRGTKFISPTELEVGLTKDDVKAERTLNVTVHSKQPDGAASNSLSLKVEAPPPAAPVP